MHISDTDGLKAIRNACGYVEDGSSQSITIGQDDATSWWNYSIDGKHKGSARSFTALLNLLAEHYKE